jgi:hypothetical protein
LPSLLTIVGSWLNINGRMRDALLFIIEMIQLVALSMKLVEEVRY